MTRKEISAVISTAKAHHDNFEYHKAEQILRQLLEDLSGNDAFPDLECKAKLGHSYSLDAIGKKNEAMSEAQEALEIAEGLQEYELKRSALSHLGGIYHTTDYPMSLQCYLKALAIAEEHFGESIIAHANINAGIGYFRMDDYAAAESHLLKAWEYYADKQSKSGSQCTRILGNINAMRGNFQQALQFYQHSFKIDEYFNNISGMAMIHGNMGNVYSHLSEYTRAVDCFTTSIKLYQQCNNISEILGPYQGLAQIHCYLQQFDIAQEYYNIMLQYLDKSQVKTDRALIYGELGLLNLEKGDFHLAMEYQQLALEIYNY